VILGTVESSLQHAAFKQLKAEAVTSFEVVTLPDHQVALGKSAAGKFFGLWRLQTRHYRLAKALLGEARGVDYVYVPYLDTCTYRIALSGSPFGETPWAGLVMRPSFHYAKMGVKAPVPSLARAREWAFTRLLRTRGLQAVFSIDEALVDYVTRSNPEDPGRLRFLPDPVDSPPIVSMEEGRRTLNLPPKRKVVLLFGSIGVRKGAVALMNAMAISVWPRDVHVLLAGKQLPEIEAYMQEGVARQMVAEGRLHVYNRFLTDYESAAAFAASDIVWCGYVGHYQMSGVLVLAGQWSKPVLACPEGLIGWLTERHGAGLVLPNLTSTSIAEAVSTLASDDAASRRFGEAGKTAYATYTVANAIGQIGNLWK